MKDFILYPQRNVKETRMQNVVAKKANRKIIMEFLKKIVIYKRTGKEKKDRRHRKQMINLNPIITLITLNVNGITGIVRMNQNLSPVYTD